MNVTVSVDKGKAFGIMDRTIISGEVDGQTVYSATKTGDSWEFNLAGLYTNEKERVVAIQEAMAQVHEKVQEIG